MQAAGGIATSRDPGLHERQCVAHMWNYICCPFCDCGFTSGAQVSPGVPLQPDPNHPGSPGAQPATARQENPLDFTRLFAEVDKFCSYILTIPGAAAHPEIKKRLDFLAASKEKLKLGAVESLARRKAHQEQLAKMMQTAKQNKEAHRKRMEGAQPAVAPFGWQRSWPRVIAEPGFYRVRVPGRQVAPRGGAATQFVGASGAGPGPNAARPYEVRGVELYFS